MNIRMLLAVGLCSVVLFGCNEMGGAASKKALVTEKDKYSYALGAHFGTQAHFQLVQRDSIDLDLAVFVQAFMERYNQDSVKYLMTDSVVFATLNDFSMKKQQEKVAKDSVAAIANLTAQKTFLDKNKTEAGVITTASGLQYKIITQGAGAVPGDSSIVTVHYTGTLLDGKKFDSSIDRGQPAEFPIAAVIPGWTEMLKLMKVGTKVQAWIPSELGYGPRGRMPMIPGNSLLVFDMELLGAKSANDKAPVAKPVAVKSAAAPAKSAK